MNLQEKIKLFNTNKKYHIIISLIFGFLTVSSMNISSNFSKERTDLGSVYENFIFAELTKNKIAPKYWRTKSKAKVDFVIENDNELIPIEVKTKISETSITKSFHSFIDKYNPKKGFIVSLDFEGERKDKDAKIRFIPLIKIIDELKKL